MLGQQRAASKSPNMTVKELNQKADDCYFGENGEHMNKEKAKEYWLKAAKMGDAHAQYALVSTNLIEGEQAMSLLRNSAEQKYPPAMNLMSRSYVNKGNFHWFPDADEEQSLYWARLSAETGDAEGQYIFGVHLNNGLGISKNYDEAEKWLTKSAEQGYLEAMKTLTTAYQKGWFGSPDIDKYLYWLRNAAELGDAVSQYNLGWELFANEKEQYDDPDQAVIWFKKASEQGIAQSYYYIAYYYWLQNDYREAEKWCRKGATNKDAAAEWFLSDMIRQQKAKELYKGEREKLLISAVEKDSCPDAKADYAMYQIDNGQVLIGLGKLEELVEQGNSRACAHYGALCILGIKGYEKFKKNIAYGVKLLFYAYEQGEVIAKEYISIPEIGNIKPEDINLK